jgi:hypothetical protein
VADQFHLEQGPVDRHRSGGVFLLAHDEAAELLLLLLLVLRRGQGGRRCRTVHPEGARRDRYRGGRAAAAVHAAPIGRTAHPAVQLRHRGVQRAVEV